MKGQRIEPILIDGLAHPPVGVTSCRWIPKVVTTDPPRYLPHTEFSWACALEAQVAILPTLIIHDGRTWFHARPPRRHATEIATISLSIRPHRWKESDEVQIGLNSGYFVGPAVSVVEPALKRDPRPFVEIHVEDEHSLAAGSSLCVASVEVGETLSAWVVVIASSDTESCRCGRWRIKRRIAVSFPPVLSFLETGRRAGTLRSGGEIGQLR